MKVHECTITTFYHLYEGNTAVLLYVVDVTAFLASPFQARCRGLPDDHVGPVRVLRIEGIDECLCCGTHVHSTSDLQVRGHEFRTEDVESTCTVEHLWDHETMFETGVDRAIEC